MSRRTDEEFEAIIHDENHDANATDHDTEHTPEVESDEDRKSVV